MVLGIDIGGTNTVYGMVDINGRVLHKGVVSTKEMLTPENLVNVLYNQVSDLLQQHNIRLRGIGIGAPNGNYLTGSIEFAPNLKWNSIVPLAKMFTAKFQVEAKLTNDANAAAMGEMKFGGAKGMKNFLFITLGTGVGSGVVVDGQMVYGHDGFAGELGHVIVEPGGRVCGCGRKGCLEAYCSASGILKTYHELSNEYSVTDSKQVAQLANAGSTNAITTFEMTAGRLGLFLANSVAYTSPEAIFIYGGPSKAGDLLFKPLRKIFEENLLMIYRGKIKILQSELPENDAAILGAASLI
jgi:glucokinase